MTTGKALNGKPYAGNPHVWFDGVASVAMPRGGSLLFKRFIVAILAAVGFALTSAGLEVNSGKAMTAARTWTTRNQNALGGRLGGVGGTVTSYTNETGNVLFHVIALEGGGYVVTSGDTLVSPIIAYSPSGVFVPEEANPMFGFLKGDMAKRLENATSVQSGGGMRLKSASSITAAEREWAELTDGVAGGLRLKASYSSDVGVSDMRVPQLMHTAWKQSGNWNGELVYNRYTPGNYPCGCVATAFAQVMRYWEYPKTSVTPFTTLCSYKDGVSGNVVVAQMTAMGGVYDWVNMPMSIAEITSVEQCEAIGKLCYDVGVAAEMDWAPGGSGASTYTPAVGLVKYYGYASFKYSSGLYTGETFEESEAHGDAILGSLDGGMPSVISITGSGAGGHAVVVDGYGYQGGTLFCHVNFGWADGGAWYNLFIDSMRGYSTIHFSVYDLHPTVNGSVVSGRVTAENGSPVSDAVVTLRKPNGTTETATTSACGIYHFRITAAGEYGLSATFGNAFVSGTTNVALTGTANTRKVDLALACTKTLSSVAISGPDEVASGNEAQYGVIVTFTDGTSEEYAANWTVEDGTNQSLLDSRGLMKTEESVSDFTVSVSASVTVNGCTADATKSVTVKAVPYGTALLMYSNNGRTVSGVKDMNGATSIIIPAGVTRIGDEAFKYCSGLTSVTIPAGVTSIGNSAFYNCSGLTSVTIPDGVTSIGNSAFYNCSGLTSVTIPAGVTSIGNSAFEGCSGLTSVTIPNSVTNIGNSAFYNCSGLTSVTIPNSVTSIGGYAFDNCSGLTSVTIPDSVTSIGNFAFRRCRSLASITIPDRVTSIGWGVFFGCSGLTSVTIPDGVTSIGDDVFYCCSGLTSMTIPAGVTSIGSSAFEGCSGLTSVTIPNSVTNIGSWAFEDCSGLTSVTIGNGVASIGGYVFSGCVRLKALYLPKSLEGSIPENAFNTVPSWAIIYYDGEMKNITFNANGGDGTMASQRIITGLSFNLDLNLFRRDGYAFVGWATEPDGAVAYTDGVSVLFNEDTTLYAVWMRAVTVSFSPNGGSGAMDDFKPAQGVESKLPSGTFTNVGRSFEGWATEPNGEVVYADGATVTFNSDITLYAVWGDGPICTVVNGVLTSVDMNGCDTIVIPSSVTSIGDSVFYDNTSLREVVIPASLASVGRSAFYGCGNLSVVRISDIGAWCGIAFDSYSANPLYYAKKLYLNGELLSSLEIPAGTTAIGRYAFYNCTSLTNVSIPSSVRTIEDYAFENCSNVTAVEMAEGVSFVGSSAFANCSGIRSLSLPASVSSVGSRAFSGCTGLAQDGFIIVQNVLYGYSGSAGTIRIPDGVCVITDYAFDRTYSIYDVTIPGSVIRIGAHAFSLCSSLTNVTLSVGLRDIGGGAFDRCSRLTGIAIPNTVTNIGGNAFNYCSALQDVSIGDSVQSIGYYAFSSCTGLKQVTIPPSVVNLRYSFEYCTGLVKAFVPSSLQSAVSSQSVFYHCSSDLDIIYYTGSPDSLCWLTLTLNPNGGTLSVLSIDVVRDYAIGALPKPKRAGYALEGWFTSIDGGERVTSETIATESLTLYAHWRESPFEFGGDADWTPEADGSWKSGVITHSQKTSIIKTVTGKGTLSFTWKVSSERSCDELTFYIDGLYKNEISGTSGTWATKTYELVTDGLHTLTWTYSKDGSVNDGSDCGWIKDVVWTPDAPVEPTIEGDDGATVEGNAESGFTVRPSAGKTSVVVMIPEGVDASKVTVAVSPDVVSVKPNGATIKIVSGGYDITDYMTIPAVVGGTVNLGEAGLDAAKVFAETTAGDNEKSLESVLDAALSGDGSAKATILSAKLGLYYSMVASSDISFPDNAAKTKSGSPTMATSSSVKIPKPDKPSGNTVFYRIRVTTSAD